MGERTQGTMRGTSPARSVAARSAASDCWDSKGPTEQDYDGDPVSCHRAAQTNVVGDRCSSITWDIWSLISTSVAGRQPDFVSQGCTRLITKLKPRFPKKCGALSLPAQEGLGVGGTGPASCWRRYGRCPAQPKTLTENLSERWCQNANGKKSWTKCVSY